MIHDTKSLHQIKEELLENEEVKKHYESVLTVVCFLWRTPDGRHNHLYEYSAEYVNKLRNMLERHLSLPHELVCVTDDPEGIDPRVRIIPTPVEVKGWPGMLRRLVIFREDAAELFGKRILLCDLDVVILRDITPLVDRPEDFVAWEPRLFYHFKGQYSRYNTGFMLMDAGARPEVWDEFSVERAQRILGAKHQGVVDEQAWITHALGVGEPVWPWDGDVRSVRATPVPQAARIVFFNGPRAPGMAAMQAEYPWIEANWR